MLSSNELSNLYKIISDENQNFENISHSFVQLFNKCDQLKIAMSLCVLIKDNILTLHQRLISFYLLYIMEKNDKLEISPFLPLIIETIHTTKKKVEQNFLLDFLYNRINYINISVKNYIEDDKKKVNVNISHIQMLYEKYNSEKEKIGNNVRVNDFIRNVLYDRKKADIKNVDNHSNTDLSNLIKTDEELSFKYYEPNYMSFCPISLNRNIGGRGKKIFDMEPIWILPKLKHNFIWENEKIDNSKEPDKK